MKKLLLFMPIIPFILINFYKKKSDIVNIKSESGIIQPSHLKSFCGLIRGYAQPPNKGF